jgi:hypothetical protein
MDSIKFNSIPSEEHLNQVIWVDVQPTTAIAEQGPIEFFVPGAGGQYIDLSETQLYVKCHITQGDGSNLPPIIGPDAPDISRMAPINNILHSMWRQIDVFWNDRLVSGSTMNYPYKAYLDALLNYGNEAKTTQLQAQGYYQDIANYMDDPDPVLGGNTASTTRLALFGSSHKTDFQGFLNIDVFQGQSSLLLNGVDLRLKLWPSSLPFFITSAADSPSYKFVLDKVVLRVCKVQVAPSVFLEQEKRLQRATAKYPYMKADITTRMIDAGQSSLNVDNVFQGRIPAKLCIGIVDSASYNGSYARNPYNFKNVDLNYIAASVNGISLPGAPFEPNFTEIDGSQYVREYLSLFKVAGKLGLDAGNAIELYDYPKGYTLYGFNIDPEAQTTLKKKTGSLNIEIRLLTPSSSPLTVILYALYPELIEIDSTRRVLTQQQ